MHMLGREDSDDDIASAGPGNGSCEHTPRLGVARHGDPGEGIEEREQGAGTKVPDPRTVLFKTSDVPGDVRVVAEDCVAVDIGPVGARLPDEKVIDGGLVTDKGAVDDRDGAVGLDDLDLEVRIVIPEVGERKVWPQDDVGDAAEGGHIASARLDGRVRHLRFSAGVERDVGRE